MRHSYSVFSGSMIWEVSHLRFVLFCGLWNVKDGCSFINMCMDNIYMEIGELFSLLYAIPIGTFTTNYRCIYQIFEYNELKRRKVKGKKKNH